MAHFEAFGRFPWQDWGKSK